MRHFYLNMIIVPTFHLGFNLRMRCSRYKLISFPTKLNYYLGVLTICADQAQRHCRSGVEAQVCFSLVSTQLVKGEAINLGIGAGGS